MDIEDVLFVCAEACGKCPRYTDFEVVEAMLGAFHEVGVISEKTLKFVIGEIKGGGNVDDTLADLLCADYDIDGE